MGFSISSWLPPLEAHLLQSPRGAIGAPGAADGARAESQGKSRETHPEHVTWHRMWLVYG